MKKLKFLTISLILVVSIALAGPFLYVSARPLAITTPNLGTVNNFAVLAASQISDVPTSTITGDVGLPAGAAITGLTCAEVTGSIYDGDGGYAGGGPCYTTNAGLLTTAATDLVASYDRLAATDNATCTTDYGVGPQDLTLVSPLGPGVYCVGAGGFALSGNLTLSGSGVWIFRSAATIITGSGSSVTGGDPCSVWWRAETSATLGTGTSFMGNILALASITDNGGSTVQGRLLARNGLVALNNTTVNRGPLCASTTYTPPSATSAPSGGGSTVSGLPDTGGAPIRHESFPWSLVIVGGVSVIALTLGVLAYRRNTLPK